MISEHAHEKWNYAGARFKASVFFWIIALLLLFLTGG